MDARIFSVLLNQPGGLSVGATDVKEHCYLYDNTLVTHCLHNLFKKCCIQEKGLKQVGTLGAGIRTYHQSVDCLNNLVSLKKLTAVQLLRTESSKTLA